MANNFVRHKAGYIPVAKSSVKAKRQDIVSSVFIQNKGFAAAAQEQGSPNGGPSPTYSGGGGKTPDMPGYGGVLP